jgi:decaprenylphospho-beta-D-ribofuranose 2-oxidase
MKIRNWGNYPFVENAQEQEYRGALPTQEPWIPRGMGRCYGDSSLGKVMLNSRQNHRFLAFDSVSGVLTCESGVTFEDLLTHFVPKGWFPPVSPGTKFVSMGGAVGADVHGKNHHIEGSFSAHVLSLVLCLPSGEALTCSPTENAAIFEATFGGMGLTGYVSQITLKLKRIESSAIVMHTTKSNSLNESLAKLEELETSTYTMAWVDCLSQGKKLGRSVLMQGEHANLAEIKDSKWAQNPLQVPTKKKITIPFYLPSFLLNPLSVRAFNFSYYNLNQNGEKLIDYDTFFYPLDAIHHWNRGYGKNGFTQYQFLIPKAAGYQGMEKIMRCIADAKMGSFLAVLKTFGKQDTMMGFPLEGYNLALDFKIEPKLFAFLDRLDDMVIDMGGRVYLAKDARLSAENFRKMYPRWEEFAQIRANVDPNNQLQSLQSIRLKI